MFKLICAALGALSISFTAPAQPYPSKPVKIVVPWPAGGVTDLAGRAMAHRLAERLSTPVVVENKAGAAGTIGASSVAQAPADGYTLLLASAETHAIAPSLRKELAYEPRRDFVAIARFAINPFSVVARPDFPAGNMKEAVALARGQPGKYTYSSAGLGSASQIAMETLKSLAQVDIVHVPFQGQAPALTSLMGGQTDFQVLPAGSAAPLRKSGKIKVYAVTTQERFFDMSDVPALREEGFEMNFANWFGLVAPKALPAPIAQRLGDEIAAALKSPETQASLRNLGLDAYPSGSPAEFQKFIDSELNRWGSLIRAANLKAE
jgi:tripartite-type tricarboxylate transporter receptor subunit TctC